MNHPYEFDAPNPCENYIYKDMGFDVLFLSCLLWLGVYILRLCVCIYAHLKHWILYQWFQVRIRFYVWMANRTMGIFAWVIKDYIWISLIGTAQYFWQDFVDQCLVIHANQIGIIEELFWPGFPFDGDITELLAAAVANDLHLD